jgi:photosystem II stability/assembly factor-like uncharacterized protein
MNANDDRSLGFDPRVADWLQGQPDRAPGQVMETVLAALPSVPQRHGLPGLPRLRTRPTPAPGWAFALLVALLALAFVAVGARLLLSLPAPIVDASPSPSPIGSLGPVSTAEPSPTPTAIPTVQTAFAPTPGMLESIADSLLASETVGWVRTDAPAAIYRTTDLGATWTRIRPPGWSANDAAAFVDAQTMYAVGSSGTIEATHDGGETWVGATVGNALIAGAPVFSFLSSTDGFATFLANGPDPFLAYHTVDGGRTWTGPRAARVPHMAASMDKLLPPIGEFLVQSAGKFPNQPFDNRFFLSSDGGVTWTQYTFPISTRSPSNAMKHLTAILREPNGRLLVSIRADSGGPTQIPDAIYESGADTATWRFLDQLPLGGVVAQFLSSTEWIEFSYAPSAIRSTVDAGAHWQTVVPDMSLYAFQTVHQFASLATGWAIEDCRIFGAACLTSHQRTLLFTTADGGKTWTQIGK